MSAYRETCDACMQRRVEDEAKAIELTKPRSKRVGSVSGPLLRGVTVLGIAVGPAATIFCTMYLQSANVATYAILVQTMSSVFLPLNKSAPQFFVDWTERRSWPTILLMVAWAPFLVPVFAGYMLSLGIWKLVKWIGTGDLKS